MMWMKDLCFSPKHAKPIGVISRLGTSWCHVVDKCQNGIPNAVESANYRYSQNERGRLSLKLLLQGGLGTENRSFQERSLLAKNVFWRLGSKSFCKESSVSMNQILSTVSRRFGHSTNDPLLSRDWLVKLWLADMKKESSRHRRKKRIVQNRSFPYAYVTKERFSGEPFPLQSPLSQSATGFLEPSSPEEFKVAPLLARSNLLITRDIEWANLMLGFEQENRYAIVDAYYPQAPVGFISEQSNVIARQILRTRRPFIARITDSMGNELFRVRRPFWWITSSIFAEIDGKEIGVVHRRWHLWRRVYDLYLGNKQFAVVENPGFWNWTFTLKDIDGKVLAEIDRDWRGFGFELLTDAGQYVIRFGDVDPRSKTESARMIQDLEIGRPLTLSERAVAVALAVSLDNDYFSRHGGWGIPFLVATE